MSLLPFMNFSTGEAVDGSLFRLLPFCKANCSGEKCKAHYDLLKNAKAGSYCCPYGLSSYVYESPEEKIVFTGLRIKGVYDKRKAKVVNSLDYIYNPVIDKSVCSAIAHDTSVSIWEKKNLETKLEAIRDLLHETRTLNGKIKTDIDLLWEENADENDISYDTMVKTLKNVHVSSFMISSRFSYFDSILNPTLSIGDAYPAVVFKKFDKMRKLLKDYQRKNVWITVDSPTQSNYKYYIYPTFETLLFILLENAIKYSPNNNPVEVIFNENGHILDVAIKSIGPYCEENELVHLCEKGFRGENAKMMQGSGQGFGLSFAKKICETHSIGLSFDSQYLRKEHGIKYGKFSVKLHFDNTDKEI